MRRFPAMRTIVWIWLAWAILMTGYQEYVRARFELQRPDNAFHWTQTYTLGDEDGWITSPFQRLINEHAAWDSGFYISIAVNGYDDKTSSAVPPTFTYELDKLELKGQRPEWISLNYSYLPFYPFTMRIFSFPLRAAGLDAKSAAMLAGILISMAGTLGAMIALYDLARDELGEPGGIRAAFYLIIFPTGMFLAQVYTEGLFLGLSFGAIALARRGEWLWAALLSVLATWTRSAGILVAIPMIIYWWKQSNPEKHLWTRLRAEGGKLALISSPLLAYLLWNSIYGTKFHLISSRVYGRGILLVAQSMQLWYSAFKSLLFGNNQAQAYYLVEFGAIAFGLLACVLMWKRDQALALYSLATIVLSLTSGSAQGMHRYILAAPAVFLLPARWGQHAAFDRAWTLGNVLLMGVYATLFTFNFWAG